MIEPAEARQGPEEGPVEAEGGMLRQDLLEVVDRRIRELSQHPHSDVRVAVEELLHAFDLVHRAGLTRLMAGIQSLAGEAFMNRLCADSAVRLLLMSYGLIPVDRRLQAEEALDTVRSHLFAHGVEIELLDVVGGVVYVRLHGVRDEGAGGGNGVPEADVRRDVEAALRHEFIGFQQLEVGERPGVQSGSLVQLGGPRLVRRPRYVQVALLHELEPDRLTPIPVEAESLLVVRLSGQDDTEEGVRAVRNQCGESPLPLEHATLEGSVLHCPWHGCRYDLRTGRRLDAGSEPSLFLLPVRLEKGAVLVAVGTEPASEGGLP